jgi:hypothetical protein
MQSLRAAEMRRIQGQRRTWHCGTHVADAAWHEGSLCSGLAVSAALGGSYPFPDNTTARIGFYELAIHHMRVLPEDAAPQNGSTLWPVPAMSISRRLTEQLIAREVAKKLSLGLPAAAFGRYSPLGWARSALVRVISPRISPYEETKKTIAAENGK